MDRCHHIGDDFAKRGDDGYSALAKGHVDFVVEEGSERVTDERSEKDERDDGVVYVIIYLELFLKINGALRAQMQSGLTYGIKA